MTSLTSSHFSLHGFLSAIQDFISIAFPGTLTFYFPLSFFYRLYSLEANLIMFIPCTLYLLHQATIKHILKFFEGKGNYQVHLNSYLDRSFQVRIHVVSVFATLHKSLWFFCAASVLLNQKIHIFLPDLLLIIFTSN